MGCMKIRIVIFFTVNVVFFQVQVDLARCF
jgi:hypothetical protein